jgi:hypothetical protein
MGRLDKYFFKSLPEYFQLNDSYTDTFNDISDGDLMNKGILQRMLDIYQVYSESLLTDVDNLYKQVRGADTQSAFLLNIAGLFNYPPFPFSYEEWFRKIITNIIALKKYRGTEEGIRRFFALFGLEASITVTTYPSFLYNDGLKYNEPGIYYRGTCKLCVKWTINIDDPAFKISELAIGPLSDNIRLAVQSILEYLIPINVVLSEFAYNSIPVDIDLGDRNIILLESSLITMGVLVQEDSLPLINEDNNFLGN